MIEIMVALTGERHSIHEDSDKVKVIESLIEILDCRPGTVMIMDLKTTEGDGIACGVGDPQDPDPLRYMKFLVWEITSTDWRLVSETGALVKH